MGCQASKQQKYKQHQSSENIQNYNEKNASLYGSPNHKRKPQNSSIYSQQVEHIQQEIEQEWQEYKKKKDQKNQKKQFEQEYDQRIKSNLNEQKKDAFVLSREDSIKIKLCRGSNISKQEYEQIVLEQQELEKQKLNNNNCVYKNQDQKYNANIKQLQQQQSIQGEQYKQQQMSQYSKQTSSKNSLNNNIQKS